MIGVAALREMDEDFNLIGGVVVDVLDFDFALRVRGENRINQRFGIRSKRQFCNRQNVLAARFDFRANLNFSAALAVVVFGEIRHAASREIGKNPEALALQMIDRRAAEIVEIVRQNLRRQTNGDAFRALRQHEREFDRQRHRLPVAPVVAQLPGGGLGIEQHLARKRRQPRLDIPRRRRLVARERVAKIPLRLDQEGALAHADERRADRDVAVRMVAHGGADDVGHLVVPAVVHFPQRVEDAALHRLEAVVDVGHGPVEDDVAGVVEEPGPVVARQRRLAVLEFHVSTRSFSTRRLPMMKSCRSGVFLPMKKESSSSVLWR